MNLKKPKRPKFWNGGSTQQSYAIDVKYPARPLWCVAYLNE